MNITSLAQYLAAFSILIPLVFLVIYWVKKPVKSNLITNLIGIYVILSVIVQLGLVYLAIEGKNNLSYVRLYIYIEVILISYIFLSYQFKEQLFRILFTISIFALLVFVDFIWGDINSNPIEIIMVESLIFTILGMLSIPEIRMENEYEAGIYYFIFAMLIYAVNNLIGRGFIQLAPFFSLNVH